MKILIVPSIREIYKNQFEYCVDTKLINLFQKIFSNSKIEIFNNSLNGRYSLIVFSGGNSSFIKNKKDKIRNKIDNQVYNFAIKKKIKIIGICHGAQFLAKKSKLKLEKKTSTVGNHKVFFKLNKTKFSKTVNSYHADTIKFSKISYVNIFGMTKDKKVEAFHVKNKKSLGIMWHPERYSKIKRIDKILIKKFYATNSIISR